MVATYQPPARRHDSPADDVELSCGIIHTIKQNCRRCYTCVRDCPAKAIRIVEGQASVVHERCIGCGNCTAVCSQRAKAYESGIEHVLQLIDSGRRVAALVAPSFPADLPADQHAKLPSALRRAGFTLAVEVAYGADLVSRAYREYLGEHRGKLHIVTACPAVVEYVRKYNPDLIDALVPIVSPMIATARAVKKAYGEDVHCVFIGPCVAKKLEARDPLLGASVDEVLTFQEMHRLFECRSVRIEKQHDGAFDGPEAGLGRVFPLVGGLLKCAGLSRSLLNSEVIVVNGPQETIEVLRHMPVDQSPPPVVEAMMCRGCYSGPGMSANDLRLMRKRRVSEYVSARLSSPQPACEASSDAPDLRRQFVPDDRRLKAPTEKDIRVILARTNKFSSEDELNCGSCGYPTCRDKAIAVYHGLAEEAMCLPFMIDQAERVCHELHMPREELRDVHRQLINTEKLASLGQMAAGIAHELNNPLGTILLYAHILRRKLQGREDLDHDLHLLIDESQRCKKIIGMLLDFARQNRVKLETTRIADIFAHVIEETAYLTDRPGLRTEIKVDPELKADIDRGQLVQALGNLVKNAAEAMEGRSGTLRLSAVVCPEGNHVRMAVSDEGTGMSAEAADRVFQPFFTTKGIGKGTGLGLPITYGIVKMHRGRIWFESNPGGGTTFFIDLPITQALATGST